MTNRPISPASTRCSSWTEARWSNEKLKPPPQSGQALQAALAPLPTTREPLKIKTNVPVAAQRARRAERGSISPLLTGIQAATAVTQTVPSNAMAVARCASTIMGGNSKRTVIAPSATCRMSRPNAAVAGTRTSRRWRQPSQASNAVKTTSRLVSDAVVRCEYSMIACTLSGGSRWPWHSGQSGHPSPDPETRTTPPSTTRAYVTTAVATARALNPFMASRVSDVLGGRGHATTHVAPGSAAAHRWDRLEVVLRRWRRRRPLEGVALPGVGRRPPAGADADREVDEEDGNRGRDQEGPDRRQQVPRHPVGAVRVPDRDPARRALEPEEVHRHEGDGEGEQLQPELDLAQALVQVATGHLRKPVEEGREDA